MAKTVESMEEEMQANADMPYYTQLPPNGLGKRGVEDKVGDEIKTLGLRFMILMI